ncbi:MAG: SH3-like domain-containing protein, partial [Pseudomonadota bacterium]
MSGGWLRCDRFWLRRAFSRKPNWKPNWPRSNPDTLKPRSREMSEFKVGDRIKVTQASPPGHVRTPLFLRGKTGVIIRHFGAFPN